MEKKILTILISLLLLIISFSGCVEEIPPVKSKMIHVDDDGIADFTQIQDAIDNAYDGDTIFVHNGTYNETLIIDKSVHLIGASRYNTVIECQKSSETSQKTVICIDADNCTIKEFKILGVGNFSDIIGVNVNSSYNTVSDNIILDNSKGINIGGDSKNNHVSRNTVSNSLYGIALHRSNNNNISKNNISLSIFDGILLYESDNNIVFGNIVSDSKFYGIQIKASEYNTVFGNLAVMNQVGVFCCCGAEYNIIYYNTFKQNNQSNANDLLNNQWDNGSVGNYWDDYNSIDADYDGIGDTPYNITGGTSEDRYPLMNPVHI